MAVLYFGIVLPLPLKYFCYSLSFTILAMEKSNLQQKRSQQLKYLKRIECVQVSSPHMSVSDSVPDARRVQKRALEFLGLELQTVASCHLGARDQVLVFCF